MLCQPNIREKLWSFISSRRSSSYCSALRSSFSNDRTLPFDPIISAFLTQQSYCLNILYMLRGVLRRPDSIEKLDKRLKIDINEVHLGVLNFWNAHNPCELSNIPFLEARLILSFGVKVKSFIFPNFRVSPRMCWIDSKLVEKCKRRWKWSKWFKIGSKWF